MKMNLMATFLSTLAQSQDTYQSETVSASWKKNCGEIPGVNSLWEAVLELAKLTQASSQVGPVSLLVSVFTGALIFDNQFSVCRL